MTLDQLIDWHKQRAQDLDELADAQLARAKDGRASRHTRKSNMFSAGVNRAMAACHRLTEQELLMLWSMRHG